MTDGYTGHYLVIDCGEWGDPCVFAFATEAEARAHLEDTNWKCVYVRSHTLEDGSIVSYYEYHT